VLAVGWLDLVRGELISPALGGLELNRRVDWLLVWLNLGLFVLVVAVVSLVGQ